jgi:hypothetical protein
MSQWKGYSPDNVLASDAGVDDGPQTAATSGALTYEPFYGLKAKPFSLSTDPRSLYKSPAHSAVLDDLLSAIRRREGIIVLTGEMGTGKTTLCRAALYQLDRKTFTTFVPDPHLSREDLLRMLLVDFGEVSVDDLRRGRLSTASRTGSELSALRVPDLVGVGGRVRSARHRRGAASRAAAPRGDPRTVRA